MLKSSLDYFHYLIQCKCYGNRCYTVLFRDYEKEKKVCIGVQSDAIIIGLPIYIVHINKNVKFFKNFCFDPWLLNP